MLKIKNDIPHIEVTLVVANNNTTNQSQPLKEVTLITLLGFKNKMLNIPASKVVEITSRVQPFWV
jgi:hypothetical protein